jgi:Ni,Fe-hydrogenase III large subunit
MKYLPLIRRIDLSIIDRIFKDLCLKYFLCGDTYEDFTKDLVRMTGNRVLQEMTLVNTLDGDDQEQSSKIRTEIEFYIKEELEDYFNEFWETSNKDC